MIEGVQYREKAVPLEVFAGHWSNTTSQSQQLYFKFFEYTGILHIGKKDSTNSRSGLQHVISTFFLKSAKYNPSQHIFSFLFSESEHEGGEIIINVSDLQVMTNQKSM